METTIDNCIDELEWIKTTGIYPYGNTQDKLHTDDYIDVVIETMRKYQKITEIETKWHNDMSFKTSMAMTEIEEVIEDGNVD